MDAETYFLGVHAGLHLRQTPVARPPALAAVVRAEDAHGRDTDPHAPGVGRINQDGVQAHPPAARRPLAAGGVPGEAGHLVPHGPPVAADEQPGFLHAGVERGRL